MVRDESSLAAVVVVAVSRRWVHRLQIHCLGEMGSAQRSVLKHEAAALAAAKEKAHDTYSVAVACRRDGQGKGPAAASVLLSNAAGAILSKP